MTSEQFERWKDFALRMARVCYSATMRAPSRKWIIEQVTEFLDRIEGNGDVPMVTSWDGVYSRDGYVCVSDEMSRFEWDRLPWRVKQLEHDEKHGEFEEALERWFGPVNCCVRAGLDIAAEPSAGVVGFTIGDLRRMYPEGLPDWIVGGFHGKRGRPVSPKTIARLKDDEPVWL